jgi:hypothetical protein
MKQMPPSQRIDGADAGVSRGGDAGELLMRNFSVTMLVAGVLVASSLARAQTYAPDYPVCLHVYGPGTHIECAFTSLAQCAATASGRGAECEVNPFLDFAEPTRSFHHQRRHHGRMHRME